ncbi:universal stress protein [Variovorax sp. CAN2819]|uniref:universal stress protein n=1 Tax=Variovorax sp. CAN15 TaxID=3046727 RepID=UPI00264930FD|nr:universal stress protein [Variovorax sp. CAN15]MDN6887953.1 universal stress protein [Variovorax sp. CAN15]
MYRRILVPIDGSPASAQGVAEAIRLARPMGSRVRLLHAIDDLSVSRAGYAHDGAPQLRAEAARMLARSAERVRRAGIEVDTVLYNETDGTVASLVADEARGWHADLIIAGTRGRRGLGQLLLGSSTERIVRGSSVPVLLVHAGGGEQADAG